jgi:hypothetical protein
MSLQPGASWTRGSCNRRLAAAWAIGDQQRGGLANQGSPTAIRPDRHSLRSLRLAVSGG